MPTVEFSPDYLGAAGYINLGSGFGAGIFWSVPASTVGGSTLGGSNARICIHSGTIPAQPRLMTATDFANTLVFWATSADCSTWSVGNSGGLTIVTTEFKTAIATGTATWFSWTYYTATPPATNGTLYQRIIGTVGTVGSGADLEMPTTSMVTGQQYRVYNLRIALPSSYTY